MHLKQPPYGYLSIFAEPLQQSLGNDSNSCVAQMILACVEQKELIIHN